jgi:hypothetical protein
MRFLYGDSTPFPLETNFIDTLKAVVAASSALLHVDRALADDEKAARAARTGAEEEAAGFDALARSLLAAIQPHLEGAEASPVAVVASRVVKAALPVLDGARGEIAQRRDAALREIETRGAELRRAIPGTLDAFFSANELPGTAWRFEWKAGPGDERACLMTPITTTFGLEALLEVDVPATSLFARAFKLADLAKGILVRVPTAAGWMKKGTELKPTLLDSFFVTEVMISPVRASFVLRRPGKAPLPGLEIVVRSEGHIGSRLRPLPAAGEPVEDPVLLDGLESTAAMTIAGKLEEHMVELAKGRRRLERATFEGGNVRALERPATLAKRLIETVAPLTHELRRRAATSTELVLKCELGSGRREEIYVERRELIDCYRDLDDERRAIFDVLGLERDLAESAVTTEHRAVPPAPGDTHDEEIVADLDALATEATTRAVPANPMLTFRRATTPAPN